MLRLLKDCVLTAAVIFVLVFPVVVCAQSPSAEEILAHARETAATRGPQAAIPELERALALFTSKDDRRSEAISLGDMGNLYEDLADYPRALDCLSRSLEMKRKLSDRLEEGKTLSNLGLVYWDMSDFPKAIDHYNRSLTIAREIHDRKLEATDLNNLGLVYSGQGEYHRALENYQQAIRIHRAIHFERGESDALGNIGGDYLDLGRFGEAASFYQQALEMDLRLKLKRSQSLDLGNLALCQMGLGQTSEAAKTFDRALAIAREGGFNKDESDWHKGKGSAYVSLGKYDLAREEYRAALQIYEQSGLKREFVEALNDDGALHFLIGDIHTARIDFQRAIELARAINHPRGVTTNLISLGGLEWRYKRYDQAAALYREAFDRAQEAQDQGAMTDSLVLLAISLRDQGRLEEALPKAQRALEIARVTGAKLAEARAQYVIGELLRRGGKTQQAIERYTAGEEIVQSVGDTELAWQIKYGKAQAFEAQGRNENALTTYRQAIEIIESVRNQLREARFRAGYVEDKSQVYVALIRLLLKTGKLAQAFRYTEKMRACSYSDLLERNQVPVASRAEADLRGRIRQLQREIEEEGAKSPPEQKREKLVTFSRELNGAERAYEAFLDDLRASSPENAASRALVVPTIREIQAQLAAHAALIEYVVGENCLAIFVLAKSRAQAKVVPISAATLYGKIELFRDLIGNEGTDDWMKPAKSLWRDLIYPVEQEHWLAGISHLYVVPNGALHYLPYAALLEPNVEAPHFLIQDYDLHYLPAASALLQKAKQTYPTGKLFALAPAVSQLRYAEEEVRNVGALFGTESLTLYGHSATKSAFTRQAGRFQVIHLATHGFFDEVNPIFSGVQLEPEAQESGRLEVHEILRLHLNARLVTLSACETALGSGYFSDYPAGEDFLGLTRAFLYAGSSEVLATLWEVNDRSTSVLMRNFYKDMQETEVGAALRKAQLSMLEAGGRYRHPYFWAPFVLVGARN